VFFTQVSQIDDLLWFCMVMMDPVLHAASLLCCLVNVRPEWTV